MYLYLNIVIYYLNKIYKKIRKIVCSLTMYKLMWLLIILFVYVMVNDNDKKSLNDSKYDLNKTEATDGIEVLKYVPKNPVQEVVTYDFEVNGKIVTKVQTRNPAIVWWTSNIRLGTESVSCPKNITCDLFSYHDRQRPANVDAYLFYASALNFTKLPLPRQPEKIIWGIFHEESPRNVDELLHEKALSIFNFSSTFSRHSNVPFPLFSLLSLKSITEKTYFIKTSVKNTLLNEISPILYMQSDCDTSTERDNYVKKLMEFIQIDSYGICLKNKELPQILKEDYLNNLYSDENLRFIAKYKFIITIENGVCDDYVSEKLWRAIGVGAVPIYFGSPLIRDWLPNNKSAILLDDYSSPKSLSEHINKLMHDDILYEEYLEHKTKGIITNDRISKEITERPYQLDTTAVVNEFECFICRKVHEMTKNTEVNIVKKNHYNCPKPITALTNGVNPTSVWVQSWENSKHKVDDLYRKVMN